MFKILTFVLFSYATAIWSQEEESEGMRAMRLGCDKQKQGLGCVNYANMLIKKGQVEKAEEYFKKACDLKFQDGCDKKRWEDPIVPANTSVSISMNGSALTSDGPTESDIQTSTFEKDGNEMVEVTATSKSDGFSSSSSTVMAKDEYNKAEESFKTTMQEPIGNCKEGPMPDLPHPLMKDFTVKQNLEKSGDNCIYTQTMPNNGLQTCTFTPAQQKEILAGDQSTFNKMVMDESICKITGY